MPNLKSYYALPLVSNVVVKDIKGLLPLRPRLLKLKVNNGNLLRIEKLTLI